MSYIDIDKKIALFLQRKIKFLIIQYDHILLQNLTKLYSLENDTNLKKLSTGSKTLWGYDMYYFSDIPQGDAENAFLFVTRRYHIFNFAPPNIFVGSWQMFSVANENSSLVKTSLDIANKPSITFPAEYLICGYDLSIIQELGISNLTKEIYDNFQKIYISPNYVGTLHEQPKFESKSNITPINTVSNVIPKVIYNIADEGKRDHLEQFSNLPYFYEKELTIEVKGLESFSEYYATSRNINIKEKIEVLLSRVSERLVAAKQIENFIENERLLCELYDVFYINYTAAERIYLDIINVIDMINNRVEKAIENPILHYDRDLIMSNSLFNENNILLFLSSQNDDTQPYIDKLMSKYPRYNTIGQIFKQICTKHLNNYNVLAQLFIKKSETYKYVTAIDGIYKLTSNPDYDDSICYFSHIGNFGYKCLLDDIYIRIIELMSKEL